MNVRDFNINPFIAVVMRVRHDCVHVIDEIELHQSDTRLMCEEIQRRYPSRDVLVCPDPTGKRKQTSSLGLSDHAIIKRYGFKVKAPKAAWAVNDKVNCTRQFIRDARGDRKLQIDPSCKRLIKSMRNLQFQPGTSHPDQKSQWSHACDSLSYALLACKHGLTPWAIGRGPRIW